MTNSNILLFDVLNVGKFVSGRLLIEHLNYMFYDLDDEVKKNLNTTLEEFISTGTLSERDAVQCNILNHLVYIFSKNIGKSVEGKVKMLNKTRAETYPLE